MASTPDFSDANYGLGALEERRRGDNEAPGAEKDFNSELKRRMESKTMNPDMVKSDVLENNPRASSAY